MKVNRVDVVALTATHLAFGGATRIVDTYLCEEALVRSGALILSSARLAMNQPGDLHDLIVLPLEQFASATVNAIEVGKL